MSDRILGPSGSRRRGFWRRRFLFLPVIAIGAAALVMSNAVAVHDEAFQLDGDVDSGTTTAVGGVTQTIDWDSLFGPTEVPTSLTDPALPADPAVTLPSGFTAAGFHPDVLMKSQRGQVVFSSADDSTFATGSKDTLPITGWQCSHSNNVGDKVDIMNAYAAAYTAGGEEFLYFGQERNGNDGDANVGFWFLQDPAVDCSSETGTSDFTGHHQDGDVFVVSAFTKGGDVSGITVYRWNGDDSGSLGPPEEFAAADCQGATPLVLPDDACATVNKPNDGVNGTIDTPWVTANNDDGLDHKLRTSEFFEGGVNLTALDLGGQCFSTFLSDTRSAQSLTATIFDFAAGQLGQCGVSTTQTWLPDDTATVTGGAPGTVTFTLYEGSDNCDADEATDTTEFGPIPVVNGVAEAGNTTEYTDDTVISWSATFTPTGQPPVQADSCESSTLTVDNDVPFPEPTP